MDNRLVLTVLFVILAWGFMGTYAQSVPNTTSTITTARPTTTTTTAASATITTAASTTNTTTAASATTTTAAPTTNTKAGPTTTTTTAASATTTTATPTTNTKAGPTTTTTAASATTTTATQTTNTKAGPTTTTTTAASATTTTAGPTTTTRAVPTIMNAAPANTTNMTTSAPPLTPNTNVTLLETPISRQQCGIQQLCAAEPSNCDPSSEASCFFLGARQTSGQNFAFALSGQTEGFIAAILSPDTTLGGNDTAYICANNNGTVVFFGALLDNNQPTVTELNVNNVKGSVNGSEIQCTFQATVPDATRTRANTTRFSMSVFTGSFNASTNALGSLQARITTNIVDLSNVNATIINELTSNTTTASPTTTASATTSVHAIHQSLMQALLITVGVLSLTRL